VLLIIFMVTASYIVQPALRVELPHAATGEDTVKTTLALELEKDGTLSLNGTKASEDEVKAFIARALPVKPDLQAVIAAVTAMSHGAVVHVIDLVRQAGGHKFAISVENAAAGGKWRSRISGSAPPLSWRPLRRP